MTSVVKQTTFSLDKDHELMMDPVTYSLGMTASTEDTIRQRITTELKTFLGEWFLDEERGFPFFTEFAKKNPDLAKIKSLFIMKISGVQDVKEVLSVDLSFAAGSRVLTVKFKVRADMGQLVEGVVQ